MTSEKFSRRRSARATRFAISELQAADLMLLRFSRFRRLNPLQES
jgi:hypothetical protein